MLCDLLDQHPRIASDGEPYNRAAKRLDRRGVEPRASGIDPAVHVARRFNRVGAAWYLYRLKFNQITQFGSTLDHYVDAMECLGLSEIIVLTRANHLRKVVSGLVARVSGQFQSSRPDKVNRKTVRIDVDAVSMDGESHTLLGQFDRWTAEYAEFDRVVGGRRLLRLNYESDIEPDPRIVYGKGGRAPRSRAPSRRRPSPTTQPVSARRDHREPRRCRGGPPGHGPRLDA